MAPSYFSAATALFFIFPLLLSVLLLYGLRQMMARTDWPLAVQRRRWRATALVLGGWLLGLAGLAATGFLRNFQTLPPRMLLVIAPPLLALVLLARTDAFTQLLRRIPPTWVLGLQSFRVVVELGLWLLFVHGTIPRDMSFEGRNLDVLTGLTAPVAAWLAWRGVPRLVLVLWNLAGLGLLLNIVVTALLCTPSPFRQFFDGPANTIIAEFPFVWLPGLLVPLAYWLHVVSLRQLSLAAQPAASIPAAKLAAGTPG